MRRIGQLLCALSCAAILAGGCSSRAGNGNGADGVTDDTASYTENERRLDADLKDVAARMALLEARLTQAEERLFVLDGQSSSVAPLVGESALTTPAPAPGGAGTPFAPSGFAAAPPPHATANEKAAYERAAKLAMSENYEAAREALTNFLERWPEGEFAPNAMYWLGETYYGEQRYAQAILTFRDVLAKYPTHHKSPDSLLKIGFAYDKLQDPANARFYLQSLVDDYPKSDSAAKARAKLRELGQ